MGIYLSNGLSVNEKIFLTNGLSVCLYDFFTTKLGVMYFTYEPGVTDITGFHKIYNSKNLSNPGCRTIGY